MFVEGEPVATLGGSVDANNPTQDEINRGWAALRTSVADFGHVDSVDVS